MNRRIVPTASFCTIGAVAMTQGFSLDVMSFNLHNGKADDGENSWGFKKNLVNERDVLADPSPEPGLVEKPRPCAMLPSQNQTLCQTFALLRN